MVRRWLTVDQPELLTFEGFPAKLEPLAKQIEDKIRSDKNYAELIVRWLADVGIAASRDPAEDARLFAVVMSKRPEDNPEKALNAMGELVGVIALTTIGVIGIFDPTPISDGAGTVVALGMVRYSGWYFVDAALSGVSMVPYLGDAVGKPALLARMASRIDDILRLLNRVASGAGRNVKVAIEAIKKGENIPPLPRGVVAVLAKVVSTTSKSLDDTLDLLRKTPDIPYAKMDEFKAYMKRRKVEVYDGDKGAELLDKLGHKDAMGCYLVYPGKNGGPPITGFIFRGQPNRSVVHHELWHRHDFLKRHGGSYDKWRDASTTIEKERYVTGRMTGNEGTMSTRGQERFGSYPPKEQANQLMYQDKLERDHQLATILDKLAEMGIKPK
jgi:hypothetical protein